MPGLARWKEEYRLTLKRPEIEEPADLWLYRPLAFLLVKILGPLPVSANHVSLASLAFGVGSGAFFALGDHAGDAAAAAAYFVCNVLDCADGQLARVRGTGSPFGYVVDGWIDHVALLSVALGIGFGFHARHAGPASYWLLVGGGATIAWWSSIVEKLRHEWLHHTVPRYRSWQRELAAMERLARRWRRVGTHPGERALVAVYRGYRLFGAGAALQSIPAAATLGKTDPAWIAAVRPVLRSAVSVGPSFQITALVAAALVGRIEWYLWLALVPGSLWAIGVLLVHRQRTKVLATLGTGLA